MKRIVNNESTRRQVRSSPAEELTVAPTGDRAQDRQRVEGVLVQVWMENYALGPLDDYRDYDRLRTIWSPTFPPHPGWTDVLRETIERLPDHPGAPWNDEDWFDGLSALMAEWLYRGPESLLPLLDDLTRPGSRPMLAFVALIDYFSLGRYPLTQAIRLVLSRVVDRTGEYEDEPLEWFVSVLEDARAIDLLSDLGPRLCESHTTARLNYEGALRRLAALDDPSDPGTEARKRAGKT